MDLEELNAKYEDLKKDLTEAKKSIDEMDKEVKGLKRRIEQLNGEAANLEEAAEKASTNDEKSRLLNDAKNKRRQAEDCQKDIKKKEAQLEVKRAKIVDLKKEIDAKIAEVMQDPEVKKQLEEALKVRKERAAKKIEPLVEERDKKEKEKDELTKRKDRLGKITEAIKKNPELKNNLVECLKYQKERRDLEEELKTCTDDTRELAIRRRLDQLKQKEIPEAFKKLTIEMKKEKLEINATNIISDIDGIIHNGLILEKDGSLNIDATLVKYNNDMAKTIKTRTMEINILNKKIEPYKDILSKKKEPAERSEVSGEQQEGPEEEQDGSEQQDDEGELEEKPKWWQFIRKRFQAWKERRETKKAQKGLPEPEQGDGQETSTSNKARKNLMESLIVRDAYDQMARSQGIETRTQARKDQGR